MQVKVCNLRSKDFSSDFKSSVIHTGFAVVTHHGIDHGLIKDVQQAWRHFYLNDRTYKQRFANETDGNQGYKGFKTEKAVGAKVADLKEFYHWRPGGHIPSEVAAPTMQMFQQLEDVGLQILSTLEGVDTGYRKCCESSDNTILRTLYYPAMDFSQEPGAVRAAPHEDINFITLLVAASAPGLEVMDKKCNWYAVPHEENSICVNIGDMLQLASEGLYQSTTHRVVNPDGSNSDRLSAPLFMHPHSQTVLARGITAKQFLDERIAQITQKA